jgi:hypothetical protein
MESRFAILFIVASGFGAMPAMAQIDCTKETWTVTPKPAANVQVTATSFHFPASGFDPQGIFQVSVSNSPQSAYCQWDFGVLAGTDASWYQAIRASQQVLNIHGVLPNCLGNPARSGALVLFAIDPHTYLPIKNIATITLTEDGATKPTLSNLKPNGGESYAQGSHQTITWTYTPSSNPLASDSGSIWLLRNGLAIQKLGTVDLKAQSFDWVVPTNVAMYGPYYGINIANDVTNCDSGGAGTSSQGRFEIKGPTTTLACPNNSGTVGLSYSSSLSATGGQPPFAFSIAGGALPAGLNLSASTGAIGGTPTTAGTASFTAQVVDPSGAPATAACSIAISPISSNCTSDDVKNLLRHVPVSSRSHIYAAGPYFGGTVMLEDALDSSQSGAVKPVSLEIASSAATGTYCAYWIDDDLDSRMPASYHYPSVKFNHPVRFAWTKHGDTSEYGVVAANNTLTIHPEGGHTPAPYTFYSDETVSGVPVTFGSGDFAAEPVPPTTTPALEQSPQSQPALQKADAFAPACLSWALIIDGGDTRKYPSGDIAAAAAADAVLMDTWLTGRGFHVQRVSQYWDNAIPQPHYLTGAQRASLFDDITKYVNRYTNTPTAPGCHHEFFLYISSHGSGSPASFYLFDSFGAGNNQGVLYDALFTRLNAFPTDLKHETTVYTMIDACHAGIAAVYARLNFKVNGIAKPGHLALQVVACGDALHTCPGGHSARVNSATQDFIKDPKTMTTGFEAMVDGTDGRNPVRLRLPDFGAYWFGLDPK